MLGEVRGLSRIKGRPSRVEPRQSGLRKEVAARSVGGVQ